MELNKLTKIATIGTGVEVHEDPIHGDETPLMLTKNGIVIAQDCWEVSDYTENLEKYI